MNINKDETESASNQREFITGEIVDEFQTDPHLLDKISSLEVQLTDQKDQRNEERFLWICITTILLLCLVFPGLSALQTTLISLLTLVLLGFAAQKLGVNWAVRLINAMLRKLFSGLSKK